MKPRSLISAILFSALTIFAALSADAQISPRRFSEAQVLRSVRIVHSAEATYFATYGNGNYGSLQQLRQASLIDEALASGDKYGYRYVLTFTLSGPNNPATMTLTATPRVYRRTGIRSFYIGTEGIVRGADKNGAPADENDPEISESEVVCPNQSIPCNELISTSSMRTLHGAQETFRATHGNGRYGTLLQLVTARLISQSFNDGEHAGYTYTVITTVETNNDPATFTISAVPTTYSVTGIRSFFVATDGILRGADRQGGPANENDPPIND